jgi:hypothetical protein
MAVNFPNSPITNQTYTNANRTWTWTGTYWKATSTTTGYTGSKGESSYTTSDTPPVNPVVGDRWFNTVYGIELVWTNDGDSTQWVEIAASGYLGLTGYTGSQGIPGFVGSQGPAGGYTGSIGYTGSQGVTGYNGSVANIYLSTAAPSSAINGTLWYKSDEGTLNIFYNDIDSFQWVEVTALGGQGFTGSKGDPGGYTGSRGDAGYTGSQGLIGYTGSVPTTETVFALTFATTLTPNAANGAIQILSASANFTFNAFSNPVSGQTITLIVTQDSTGSRVMTSNFLFAGGSKTLSTAPGAIDMITVSYIGGIYYASLVKGFN